MNHQVFVKSPQIEIYNNKENRLGFDSLYESERATLDYVLPHAQSLTDIGCLNGDTFQAIQDKYPSLRCQGVDIDEEAIRLAQARYPQHQFLVGDFMAESFRAEKSDLVLALNLFDHFQDWKSALRNFKRFSNRYINFSSLLRLQGPSLLDPETNFIYYGGAGRRLLWAVHNIFELAAYCATEEMNAISIYAYCYHKYRQQNIQRAAHCCHPFTPSEMIVGNVVIEFDDSQGMSKTNIRPDLKIVLDGEVVFDSPWKN